MNEYLKTDSTMSRKMAQRIISYITDILFGTGNMLFWFIPAGRFDGAAVIPEARQAIGKGMAAQSLHRPVARNGIKRCSR